MSDSQRPTINVFPNGDALTAAAAERFAAAAAQAIRETGRFVVALSGGSTPNSLYARLAAEPYQSAVEWAHVHVYWGDERCVPPHQLASNFRMAREALLDHVAISRSNVHRISGEDEPDDAAARYEHDLRSAFATPTGPPQHEPGRRFDLVLLGLGLDGHTASLFPGTPAVREADRWVVAQYIDVVHMARVSLTPPVINQAANVVFLISGADKASIVHRVIDGPHVPDTLPAQVVAPRNGVFDWLVDAAAAAELGAR